MKPASQDIASKFALLCLAQFPANKLDAVMVRTKILAETTFIISPFFIKLYVENVSGTSFLKSETNNCVEMTRLVQKRELHMLDNVDASLG